MLFRASAS